MSKGFITELGDRAAVVVGGAEARSFLQNVVTADMDAVHDGAAGYGALLSPQGKVLFDFLILADGDRYLIDLPQAAVAEFMKRLSLYRLRAKVTIETDAALGIHAAWPGRPFAVDAVVGRDPRHPALGYRLIGRDASGDDSFQPATAEAFHARRVRLGVPEGGVDFVYGDAFPHDANIDRLGGVTFDKGCYIGQEVVSRMQHRGTARRRVIPIEADMALPPTGTAIEAEGRPIGTVGSVAGRQGLALVRIDRAASAIAAGQAIAAGAVPVRLQIPDWAKQASRTADAED
jgi:hypothetical protein